MKALLQISVLLLFGGCLRGPMGPEGPSGRDGDDAVLNIYEKEGTIFNANYTTGNSSFVSIHVNSIEPTILFFGLENSNGVFNNSEWSAVIYGGSNPDYTYGGNTGYFLLVYDPDKELLTRNYKLKYTY